MELHRKPRQAKTSEPSVNPVPSPSGLGHPQAGSADDGHGPGGGRRPGRQKEAFRPNPKARLLDQCREVLRFHHCALRTEQSYVQWIRRYIVFHGKRHPKELGKKEILPRRRDRVQIKQTEGAEKNERRRKTLPLSSLFAFFDYSSW